MTEFYSRWHRTNQHCINYFRNTKTLDLRRHSKMDFVSVYFLSLFSLERKKKVLLKQTLRKSVWYCMICISTCQIVVYHYYDLYYDNNFLKLLFFRYSYQMLFLHCHSCQITEKQQWILHLEYTKQIRMPKILGRKWAYEGKYKSYKDFKYYSQYQWFFVSML